MEAAIIIAVIAGLVLFLLIHAEKVRKRAELEEQRYKEKHKHED